MSNIEIIPKIEDIIYEIRGCQVMLDSDLAKLYNVETKRINEAVKNNPQKFPERFSWRLTDFDSKNFLVENFDQKTETRGGRFKNPRVFTEQGVAMLATILKSETAIQTSINIMDAFVKMRHFIKDNLSEQKNINNIVLEDHSNILKLNNDVMLLQEAFDKLEEKRKVNEIYFNGQIYDAYSKILDIFSEAKHELIIIDNYADKTILDIIKNLNIKIIIITTDKYIKKGLIDKYYEQYNNLKVIYNNTFHDRYFIIDKCRVYHSGASINRIGYKTFSINILQDNELCSYLINKINSIINLQF